MQPGMRSCRLLERLKFHLVFLRGRNCELLMHNTKRLLRRKPHNTTKPDDSFRQRESFRGWFLRIEWCRKREKESILPDRRLIQAVVWFGLLYLDWSNLKCYQRYRKWSLVLLMLCQEMPGQKSESAFFEMNRRFHRLPYLIIPSDQKGDRSQHEN